MSWSNRLGKELKLAKKLEKLLRQNYNIGGKFDAKKIKIFAECIYIQHSAKRTTVTVPSKSCDGGRLLQFFAECNSLPSVFIIFCQAYFFTERISLPSVFLFLCRVYFFVERVFAREKTLGKDTWQNSFFP